MKYAGPYTHRCNNYALYYTHVIPNFHPCHCPLPFSEKSNIYYKNAKSLKFVLPCHLRFVPVWSITYCFLAYSIRMAQLSNIGASEYIVIITKPRISQMQIYHTAAKLLFFRFVFNLFCLTNIFLQKKHISRAFNTRSSIGFSTIKRNYINGKLNPTINVLTVEKWIVSNTTSIIVQPPPNLGINLKH